MTWTLEKRPVKKIRSLIENTPVDEELQDYMGEFYRRLSKKMPCPGGSGGG